MLTSSLSFETLFLALKIVLARTTAGCGGRVRS